MSEVSIQVKHGHESKTKKMPNVENVPIENKSFYKKSNGHTSQMLKECDDSLDIKLGRLSSSSSLSWSDEYESEITKKVYEKLRRIDRVLKHQEEFPSHYDKEEFGQWMRIFPNISIFDPEPAISKDILVFGRSSSRKSDKVSNKKEPSVINPEFMYNRLLTQRSGNNRKRHIDDFNTRNKNIFTISSKPKSLDIDRSLKIIPVKKQAERKTSTKSLKIRQLSKEYTETPLQFDSLPFIEMEEVGSENRKPSGTKHFRNKNYLNCSSTLGKNSNLLILPPIHGYKLRSISATPSQDKLSKVFLI